MTEQPRLPVEMAISRILAAVSALPAESVPVDEALGRVLREAVHARYTHPAWRNSAMDGYTMHAADVHGATSVSPVTLIVGGTIAAGDAPPASIAAGTAWRIMTGAPVPDGADTVIRVEDTDAGVDRVTIRNDRDAGRNIRARGEDFMEGAPLLASGTTLHPAHIGVAAGNGCATLMVTRRPRVAILSSGNELVDVDEFDEVLRGRRIINTNGHALAAAVRDAGGVPVPLGVARDDPAAIAERINGAPPFDALITCGGISVGAFDYTRDVITRLGATLDFWRVRMRPGGPFGFGMLRERPWFGLPGNPVSALVTFEVFVRPALRQMGGHASIARAIRQAKLVESVTAQGGLTQFLRVIVDGAGYARLTGPQGSGLLTSMAAANALLIVPHTSAYLEAGTTVPVMLTHEGFDHLPMAAAWTY